LRKGQFRTGFSQRQHFMPNHTQSADNHTTSPLLVMGDELGSREEQ